MDQPQTAMASTDSNTQEAYPTLSEFLTNLKLSRYYSALLDVGVADDDIPQLLRIEETDLRELLNSVGMLPFHAIAFRSTLRLLRKSQASPHTPPRDEENLRASPEKKVCVATSHHYSSHIQFLLLIRFYVC
jgi:hypothetical protein